MREMPQFRRNRIGLWGSCGPRVSPGRESNKVIPRIRSEAVEESEYLQQPRALREREQEQRNRAGMSDRQHLFQACVLRLGEHAKQTAQESVRRPTN
jgi:hypothetical protein